MKTSAFSFSSFACIGRELCGYRLPAFLLLKLVPVYKVMLNKMIPLSLYKLLFEFENAFIIHFCTSLFI